MGVSTIDAKVLRNAFLAGAEGLEVKKDWVNELSVSPVPGGDTGASMTLTIMSTAKGVVEPDSPTIDQLAKAISSGSLREARGNSDIILSQLPRESTKKIKSVAEMGTTILANAMARGTETAYKAVTKPREDMILTVTKDVSDKALEMISQTDDIEKFARVTIEHGDYVLSQTPEMLPAPKQVGVVDSGSQSLVQVVEDVVSDLLGKTVDPSLNTKPEQREEPPRVAASRSDIDTVGIRFGYCTEFTISLEKEHSDQDETELKACLESIEDPLVVASDDKIVKIHIHTSHPGLAFEKALTSSSLSHTKVDNMGEEHRERVIKDSRRIAREQVAQNLTDTQVEPEERREYDLIAVSSNDGLSEVSKGIGANYLIGGGQTVSPSIEDMFNAIDEVNTESIFILLNNKNIIMTAQQARDLTEDKNIIVISSRTVPQGITALMNFAPDLSAKENLNNMAGEMLNVKTIQVAYAVRATKIDGMDIEEEDIMAIGDQGMLAAGESVESVAMDALDAMLDQGSELVTVYHGCDIPQNAAGSLIHRAAQLYPDKEIELQCGGQSIHCYMISTE